MTRQQSNVKEVWINDLNNKKYALIKNNFLNALQQQAKDGKIGYYDFLLVAKKLYFRFQQSAHLMALKNYFSKNKNLILCKKLSDFLSISQQSLLSGNQQKIIVKFTVPDIQFAPIKQETLEDQDFDEQRSLQQNQHDQQQIPFRKMGNQIDAQHERQLMQKMAIILSIKVQQMHKKLLILSHGSQNYSLLTYFDSYEDQQITYELFKKGIVQIISNNKQKVKVSEDDVKTIFHLLDEQKKGFITAQQINKLKNLQQSGLVDKMKQFYKSRLNKDMVKNTLFKLGKVKNNSIQIYQLKNASIMQFKQMEDAILDHNQRQYKGKFHIRKNKQIKQKSRIPHFGPLKGAAKWKNKPIQSQSQPHYPQTYSSTHPNTPNVNIFSINKQRQKIQKILRQSKDSNKYNVKQKNGQTVASKLRSLFIHKVILPRQKMLQQEKDKFLRSKLPQQQLSIKPYK